MTEINGWRWNDLSEREKRLCYLRVVKGMKLFAAGRELGIGRTRVTQVIWTTYRILGVESVMELAFEMGRHWEEIKP
jgi:hypothetical protein